ncbi:TetR/AcrR family transcriptional regulator [Sphaerisporangium corydalis]|uniref:TetR/AcrR family transcriptional regulator n=1 Tax=Sphaerisporangium corydalis TaxID=1441875 RepID=A0ABV9EFU6_9ACTN|nr:TetR/AcrR family transcriptional regulator [Sphaerisporangium corydalis]
MTAPPVRPGRGRETRASILAAAERLFAEHGIAMVSNRQIGEAAGQSNNYAVGYHFGTKADLVRAIARHHAAATERRRLELLAAIDGSPDLREWVACLVRPTTGHLASLGAPTWYARFIAQADTEPALRQIVIAEVVATPSMRRNLEGLFALVPALPEGVRRERGDMSRLLIVHMLAERERALHEGTEPARATWEATAVGLIDAIVGLWLAPVTSPP